MKLTIKEQYNEWSIPTKTQKKVKLANLDPSLYGEVYKSYPEFFEVVTQKPKEIIKEIEKINDSIDDTNK